MVNRTGQGSQIATLDRRAGVTGRAAPVRYSGVSATPENPGAPYEALARNFASISNRLENRLDVIASDEAQAAGLSAGGREDVALRRDGTIRGRAFDAAATRAMSARHDTQARVAADEIYQRNKDNPGLLKKELDDYAQGVNASNLPEEVKVDFDLSFQRISAGYMSDAAARAERLQLDADRAAALENIEERRKSIERLARLSENDAQAAVLMAAEIDDLKTFALGHGPKGAFEFDGVTYGPDAGRSGAYSLEDIQRLVMTTSDAAREQRMLGKFMQAGSVGEKSRLLKAFESEFISGDTDFDLDQYDRISGRMRADLNRLEADQRSRTAGISKELTAVNKMIEKGYNPGEGVLESLEVQASLAGDPAAVEEVRAARNLWTFQDQLRQLRPDQLQTYVNDVYAQMNEKGAISPQQVRRVELAEKLLSEMNTELARDPLSWANRTGVVQLKPISFEDPDSLSARAADASAAAAYYGTRPKLMTDEEVGVWKTGWDMASADQKTAMIAAIQDGFKDDAVYAFEDLAQISPALANVGGLVTQSPAHAVTARDLAIGDAAIAAGTRVVTQNAMLRDRQARVLGNAYGFTPGAMAAVIDTAERLYTARALRQGLSAETFDYNLYDQALQEAAGQWTDRDGQLHGGIFAQRGGHKVVLPPSMTDAEFESIIENADEFSMLRGSIGNGAGLYENGKVMQPQDLKKTWLISSGPGRYLVSKTNPAKGPPSFVLGTNPDGLFELDVTKMKGGAQ